MPAIKPTRSPTWVRWALVVQTACRHYGPHDVYIDGCEVIVRRVERKREASPLPESAVLLGRYAAPISRPAFYDDLRAAGIEVMPPNKGGREARWPSYVVAGFVNVFRKAVDRDRLAELVWLPGEQRLMARRPIPPDAVVVGVFDKTAAPETFVEALLEAVPSLKASTPVRARGDV